MIIWAILLSIWAICYSTWAVYRIRQKGGLSPANVLGLAVTEHRSRQSNKIVTHFTTSSEFESCCICIGGMIWTLSWWGCVILATIDISSGRYFTKIGIPEVLWIGFVLFLYLLAAFVLALLSGLCVYGLGYVIARLWLPRAYAAHGDRYAMSKVKLYWCGPSDRYCNLDTVLDCFDVCMGLLGEEEGNFSRLAKHYDNLKVLRDEVDERSDYLRLMQSEVRSINKLGTRNVEIELCADAFEEVIERFAQKCSKKSKTTDKKSF